jgi:flagellin-specific chaperone FliS
VQKVIAVSDEQQLEKIEGESEGLPEEFRRALGFWRVNEVRRVGENLQSAMEIINRLGLGTF